MTVGRDHDVVRDGLAHGPYQLAELGGRGVAHRVGDVDGGGPARDRHAEALQEELQLGPGRVLRRELDIFRVALREPDVVLDRLQDLLRAHPQHRLALDVGRRDERVDPPPLRALEGLSGAFDVAGSRPRERRDHRTAHGARDLADGIELTG